MGLFSLTIQLDKKTKRLLEQINCKLDKILSGDNDTEAIVKATKDLDTSTNELKSAVEKNTPK